MKKIIEKHIFDHSSLISGNIKDIILSVEQITKEIKKTFKKKKTIFFAGNGGSAADCEHIAGELVGRYQKNRKPYKAISLTTDTSVITCIANDFGYDKIFERQLEGLGQKGDLLIVFSTSGESKNIINLLKKSKKMNIKSIALLGKTGGQSKNISNYSYVVPSYSTANIQEVHHLIGHIFCSLVD
jgi:D-sedoheptulose 7-phosphate isomerase